MRKKKRNDIVKKLHLESANKKETRVNDFLCIRYRRGDSKDKTKRSYQKIWYKKQKENGLEKGKKWTTEKRVMSTWSWKITPTLPCYLIVNA